MATSVDGKTTQWYQPNIYKWISKEDQEYFLSLVKKHGVIIMGRKTYFAAASLINLFPKKLRIVLTRNPDQYTHLMIPRQLEFTNDQPRKLLKELELKGYSEALLVGGEEANSAFLKEKAVDEMWITFEPKVFGSSNGLVSIEKFEIDLKLIDIVRLNKKGTLLAKYKVL